MLSLRYDNAHGASLKLEIYRIMLMALVKKSLLKSASSFSLNEVQLAFP